MVQTKMIMKQADKPGISLACLAVFTALSGAGDRVTTSWLGASDGSYLESSNWSMGVPQNQTNLRFDAMIDAVGIPYIVRFDPARSADPVHIQTLSIGSPDATLSLENQFNAGSLFVHESMVISAGTLELGQAGLIGSGGHVPMVVAPGAGVTIHPSVTDQSYAKLQGFDIIADELFVAGNDALCMYGSGVVGGTLSITGATIGVNTPVSYDIQLGRAPGETGTLNTPLTNLEIEQGVEVSGYGFRIQRFTEPFFGPGLGGSFINHGVITSLGGDSDVQRVTNLGLIAVTDGRLTAPESNDGVLRASESGELSHYVTNSGSLRTFTNRGVIEADGPNARYVVNSRYINEFELAQSFWFNEGVVRLINGAHAEIGSAALNHLGKFERDQDATIAITGPLDLEGGTLTQQSFAGPVTLQDPDDPYILSVPIIHNGSIERPMGWLLHKGDEGRFSQVSITGGDWIVDTRNPNGGGASGETILSIQNVDVPDGDIVLAPGAYIRFQHLETDGGDLYTNETIRSQSRSGFRTKVGIMFGNPLTLGPDARVTGAIDFGVGNYLGRRVINHGIIESDSVSGLLRFRCPLENEHLVRTSFTDIELEDVQNSGVISAFLGGIETRQLENSGTIDLQIYGWIHASSTLTLTEDSKISVIPASQAPPCIASDFPIELRGEIEINCAAILEAGRYQILSAPMLVGRFDRLRIVGLQQGFEFAGLDQDGFITIKPLRSVFGRGPLSR